MAVVETGTDLSFWDKGARKAAVRVLSLVAHPERRVDPNVVESQCSKHCGRRAQEVEAVIQSWLEWYRSTGFVRRDAVPAIFALLKAELATQVNDELVWALGTLDPHEVVRLGEEPCPHQAPWVEVADRAIGLIRGISGSDSVLLPDSFGRGLDVSKDGIVTGGPLRVLEHIKRFPDLVRAVVPSVTNLVRWSVLWRGVAIVDVLEDGVHPCVYGLVAEELARKLGGGRTTQLLSLIQTDSKDQLVALAIHETLRVASELRASERRVGWGVPTDQPSSNAPAEEIALSVRGMLQSLPTALTVLEPSRSLGWIAQLLSGAERIYGLTERERAGDLELLFSTAEKSAAGVLGDGEPFDVLLDAFTAPLVAARRPSKIYHLEAFALRLEHSHPKKACAARRVLLDEYRKQLSAARTTEEPLEGGDDGFRRDDAMASALARECAANPMESAVEFLDGIYAGLGLSIWDCEEDGDQFRRDIRIAENLIGVGALAALHAHESESISMVALAEWCATRLWSNDQLIAHLEHGFDRWQKMDVLATVIVTMLMCIPDPETRIRSLMSDAEFPNRALASIAKHATNKEIQDEAAGTLVRRFEDKVSLGIYDAREWAKRLLALGDPQRGLQAMDMVPPGLMDLEPYDHVLVVRLVLSTLEASDLKSRRDRGELKLRAQQAYRLARHYLLDEGSDEEIRGRMEAMNIRP